jgi:hypothetical protein
MSAVLPHLPRGRDIETSSPADPAARGAPIIVLTYPHSGAKRLWSLLTASPTLACTSGTGILPLCKQSAIAWSEADGQLGNRMSQIAITSTRVLTTSIITSILARQGKRRWCEFATAPPESAENFLQIHPGTRFLIFHRNCADVILSSLSSDAWERKEPESSPFNASYPASAAAAVMAFWVRRTESLIAFEGSNPKICRRVRYEDITTNTSTADMFDFLGIEPIDPLIAPGDIDVGRSQPDPKTPFAAQQIPAPLLARANTLHRRLGYSPLLSA